MKQIRTSAFPSRDAVAAALLLRRARSIRATRPATATTAAVTPPAIGHTAAPVLSGSGDLGTPDSGSAGLATGDAGDADLGMPCGGTGTWLPRGTAVEGSAAELLVTLGTPATPCT
jgi:hypothetical protein